MSLAIWVLITIEKVTKNFEIIFVSEVCLTNENDDCVIKFIVSFGFADKK